MDSDKSAESASLTKNKKLMFVAGQRRYVEVLQCSGDEMALVLQQGLPAPMQSLSSVSSSSVHAAGVVPAGYWSLPPPSAPASDLALLLHQRSSIPLPAVPGMATSAIFTCMGDFALTRFFWPFHRHPSLNRRRSSFSGRRIPTVEHSAAERHVGAVTDCFAGNASRLISSFAFIFPRVSLVPAH